MAPTHNNRKRKGSVFYVLGTIGILAIAAAALGVRWVVHRYATGDTMIIPLKESSSAEYPEDPAAKSINYGRYSDRQLKLVKRDATHFDFVFESKHDQVATVVFKDIDVSRMTLSESFWTKRDPNIQRIALTDRQWNRQQVRFPRGSEHLQVSGGNGFERNNLIEGDLAKNCLNAGLWEVDYRARDDEGLEDRTPAPRRVWNKLPTAVTQAVLELALKEPELSPRELAVSFVDRQQYFVSEASVYRLLKAHDLITSPAFILMKAGDSFAHPTTASNQLCKPILPTFG